jgi:hypothetical protein
LNYKLPKGGFLVEIDFRALYQYNPSIMARPDLGPVLRPITLLLKRKENPLEAAQRLYPAWKLAGRAYKIMMASKGESVDVLIRVTPHVPPCNKRYIIDAEENGKTSIGTPIFTGFYRLLEHQEEGEPKLLFKVNNEHVANSQNTDATASQLAEFNGILTAIEDNLGINNGLSIKKINVDNIRAHV